MQYLEPPWVEKYKNFANHNLEKLCLWSLALASTVPTLGLERVCLDKSILRLGLGFFKVVGLEGCVLDLTSASYDAYQNACKKEFYLPNRLQKIILVFEPTLLVVIRIWCFDKWFISLFMKDKAMIKSVYVKKQITKARWKLQYDLA